MANDNVIAGRFTPINAARLAAHGKPEAGLSMSFDAYQWAIERLAVAPHGSHVVVSREEQPSRAAATATFRQFVEASRIPVLEEHIYKGRQFPPLGALADDEQAERWLEIVSSPVPGELQLFICGRDGSAVISGMFTALSDALAASRIVAEQLGGCRVRNFSHLGPYPETDGAA